MQRCSLVVIFVGRYGRGDQPISMKPGKRRFGIAAFDPWHFVVAIRAEMS